MFVVLGALQAFRLGWIAANLTETEAIEAYSSRFAAKEGRGLTGWTCFGEPGLDVWLIVRCGLPGQMWHYEVNRFGGLVGIVPPGAGAQEGRPRA
ncbi:hypothetical protein [Tropicibacter sp. S64]|uniref:hypothetical protein n=1 Tax=Tropicibacter sp. S64 TaxID=3415122 RepID=UPI003C7C6F99